MKHVEVKIMGQTYLLGCPDGGETQLQTAVDRVDTAMCKIRDAGKVKARDRIAVLAALNLAFDLGQFETATGTQSTAGGATDTAGIPAEMPADDARQAHLLQRLNQALAGDDHLL